MSSDWAFPLLRFLQMHHNPLRYDCMVRNGRVIKIWGPKLGFMRKYVASEVNDALAGDLFSEPEKLTYLKVFIGHNILYPGATIMLIGGKVWKMMRAIIYVDKGKIMDKLNENSEQEEKPCIH